jgi:hypothetical protein
MVVTAEAPVLQRVAPGLRTGEVTVFVGHRGPIIYGFIDGMRLRHVTAQLIDLGKLPDGLDRIVVDGRYGQGFKLRGKKHLRNGMILHFTANVEVTITDIDRRQVVKMRRMPLVGLPYSRVAEVVHDATHIALTGEVVVNGREITERQMTTRYVKTGDRILCPDP